jgi:phosphoribosylaminoimidazolecarboxamide formyltransferase/IMP cyclohydrolase
MIRTVGKIDDHAPIKNVMIAVSDETGLDILIPGLIKHCPGVTIYASDNNYSAVARLMPPDKIFQNLLSFWQLARKPEVNGTVIETLQPRVFLGLLGKTYCRQHQDMIKDIKAIPFDLAIINLRSIISAEASDNFEIISTRIDVPGQAALAAAIANPRQVMTLSDHRDYATLIEELEKLRGHTGLESRLKMAVKGALYLQKYSSEVADFLSNVSIDEVRSCYEILNPVKDLIKAEN